MGNIKWLTVNNVEVLIRLKRNRTLKYNLEEEGHNLGGKKVRKEEDEVGDIKKGDKKNPKE